MQIVIDRDLNASLQDRSEFSSFRVLSYKQCTERDLREALACIGSKFDGMYGWINQDWLRNQGDGDDEWQKKLAGMVEFARSRGWVDPASGNLRAHISVADVE